MLAQWEQEIPPNKHLPENQQRLPSTAFPFNNFRIYYPMKIEIKGSLRQTPATKIQPALKSTIFQCNKIKINFYTKLNVKFNEIEKDIAD